MNAREASIRQYRSADQNDLVELWSVCRLLRPWNDPLEDIHLCVTTPSSELVVADSAGQVIGSAMLGHDGHRGWVYYLAVHPKSNVSIYWFRPLQQSKTDTILLSTRLWNSSITAWKSIDAMPNSTLCV